MISLRKLLIYLLPSISLFNEKKNVKFEIDLEYENFEGSSHDTTYLEEKLSFEIAKEALYDQCLKMKIVKVG